MREIHPVTAALALIGAFLTAEWFIKRERSLIATAITALGG